MSEPKCVIKLTQRQYGVECEVTMDGPYNDSMVVLAADVLADTVEQVDGIPGYRTKRDTPDEEKARRKAYAIAARRGKA